MWGAIIGAALSAAGSIYGGIKSSRAAQKAEASNAEQRKKNQDWYDRRYNEDPTQRADAQYVLNQVEENIRKRNRAAAGTAAVMGGDTAAVAAEKERNNKALADATAQIVAGNEARKDNIENQYLERDNAFAARQDAYDLQKANAIAEAAKGVGQAGGSIASAFDFKDSTKPKSIFDTAQEARDWYNTHQLRDLELKSGLAVSHK